VTAIVILGMHRSGTSCVAGMLAAGGVASAGTAIRNWDNARGHHEMLAAIRLDEAVLAHSGGHWLAAPAEVRWTAAHAAERDRLLATPIDGRPPLLKDPRMLLVLPLWRAASVPFRALGVIRHPLAVARSLEAWRGLLLGDGIALWIAHNRALAADRAAYGYPIVDFDQPAEAIGTVRAFAPEADPRVFEPQLVHHDVADPPPGLDEALALYRELGGTPPAPSRPFPRAELAAFLASGSLADARRALAAVADATAVLVPVIGALVRRRAYADARQLIDETALEPGVADLLHGKLLLAMGDARAAVRHLEAACAVAQPMFQAKNLLPHALRGARRRAEARDALRAVAAEALYPHGPLAILAEWSWRDGDRARALAEMAEAIAAAPPHRRGRLRTRRGEWLIAEADRDAARRELEQAIAEDPGYPRSRDVLMALCRSSASHSSRSS
jgi:tetratricopeptide (TPR) repeat protein